MILAGIGLLAVMLAAAVLARWTHRESKVHTAGDGNSGLQVHASLIATFYGVLLAMILVGRMDEHRRIEAAVDQEASRFLFLYRLAESLPEPAARDGFQKAVQAAVGIVIRQEWPAMERRQTHDVLLHGGGMDAIWKAIVHLDRRDPTVQLLADQAASNYASLLEARRLRLTAADKTLHPVMWLVLAAGGSFCLVLCAMVALGRREQHALFSAMSTGLVYLLLWLVAQYQYPFEGTLAISPTAFTRAAERMAALDAVSFQPGR